MDVKITNTLYLRSDQYCCWLVRVSTIQSGDNAGKTREEIIGYYRSPRQAFNALLAHRIRTSEAQDLKELISLVKAHNSLTEAFLTDKLPKVLKK